MKKMLALKAHAYQKGKFYQLSRSSQFITTLRLLISLREPGSTFLVLYLRENLNGRFHMFKGTLKKQHFGKCFLCNEILTFTLWYR